MTKQEKQMLVSVRTAYSYGAGKRRMKKVYRKLYPRIKARKRVQLIELASLLRHMDKYMSGIITPYDAVTIYDRLLPCGYSAMQIIHDEVQWKAPQGLSSVDGFMVCDLEVIGGPWHETHSSSYEDIGQWVYDRAVQLKEQGLRWGLAVAMARREFNEQQDPEVYELPE